MIWSGGSGDGSVGQMKQTLELESVALGNAPNMETGENR